jgi:ribosomal-protein-alanine N-acetyltransferase
MPTMVGMAYPDQVPVLTDGVVTLRAYRLDDLDGVVAQCTDPDSVAWTTIPVPYTRDDGVTWITKTMPALWADGSDLTFAVEAPHRDGVRRFAGGVGLRPQTEGLAELTFGLHPDARGLGICSRAVKLVLDWGFPRGHEVITWYAYVGNWPSRRVMWANGFTFHGTIANFLPQRGRRRDIWMGTLRSTDSREPKSAWFIPPVLDSDRLRLRPYTDADAGRLFETMHDERSVHWGGLVPNVRPATPEAGLLRIRERLAAGQMLYWAIADRDTDRYLGGIQIFDFEGLDPTEVKYGYSVHPDARGRGVLTETLRTLSAFVFRPASEGGLGRRRISISTAAGNKASRHAAERAGFTHVATNPAAFPLTPTTFDDEVHYQLLNPTWQAP